MYRLGLFICALLGMSQWCDRDLLAEEVVNLGPSNVELDGS